MMKLLHQKILRNFPFLILFLVTSVTWAQSTVTVGSLSTSTGGVITPATYTGIPAGATFSTVTKGSGVSNASAGDAASGAQFNTTSPDASFTANKFYSLTITADATHTVTLTSLTWLTQLSGSGGSARFTVRYKNNGGALTGFGTEQQTGTTTNTFTGSVTIAAGTSLQLYFIPSNADTPTRTIRFKNGSSFNITVGSAGPVDQTITFTNPVSLTKTYGDANFTLGATATSGLTVTYTSSDTDVATISGNTVTIVGAGTSTITANQAGNAGFNPAPPVGRTLTVNPKSLTISGITIDDKNFDGNTTATINGTPALVGVINSDDVTVDATAATAQFASSAIGTDIAVTVSGYTLAGTKAANYTLTQPTGLTADITASQQAQTITFDPIAGVTYGDASFTLGATASSGLTVSYSSSDTSVATVSGNTVTIVGTGSTNITASQIGDANYTAALDVIQPLVVAKKAITITGIAANDKIYDGNTTVTIAGAALNGADIVGSDVVALDSFTAAFDTATAGTDKSVTVAYTLTGAQADRYILTQPTGITADITAKGLTLTGISISDKDFDGTTTATITGTPTLVGVITPDDVTVDASAATAQFASSATGTDIAVTVSGYALTGADAANYTLVQPTGLTADINIVQQAQIITFDPIAGVTYGDASFSLGATASSGLTVSYASSDTSVATVSGNTVTIVGPGSTNITASQIGDANYTAALDVIQPLVVAKKAITITGIAANDKIYDGNTTVTIAGAALNGADIVGSDVVALDSFTAAFDTATAGTDKSVTVAYTLTGAQADRYILTQPTGITADITAKGLTLTGISISDKDFDGTTTATITGTPTLVGVITPDDVTVDASAATAQFASSATGTDIAVTVSGYALAGADAANYTLIQPTGLTADINIVQQAQTITFDPIAAVTYGDASFTLGATASSGLTVSYVSSDTSVATVSGNTVTIVGPGSTNITASQIGDANYTAALDVIQPLVVAKKAITITGIAANDKIYDGNTTVTITGAALNAADIVGSDVVALDSFTASFDTATAGTDKTVTVAYTLTGAQADRYILTQPTSITADITAKELSITGIAISDKEFDGNTIATITGTPALVGVINPDDVALNTAAATAQFTSSAIGASIPVTVSGYALTGTAAANYTLAQPTGLTANILDVTLQDQTITFGALTAVTYGDASFTLNATSDSGLTVSYTSSDTSVATITGNTVTIVGPGTTNITALQVGDAAYNPAPSVIQPLVVNKKGLTVINATANNKTYDKTTNAVVNGTLSGVINSDVVILNGTGTFASDDVANNIVVTTNYTITGTDSNKYILTQPGALAANITAAALTLTGAAAQNKAYDGNTNAVVTGTLSGVVGGDVVTFNGSAVFASENVASGIAVTSTATLIGTDAANYTLTQPTGLTANITGIPLTVVATAADKVYDRTTTATLNVTQVNGIVSGDDVTVSGNGTFADFNVGTDTAITANLVLTGADTANYTLTQPTGLTADITAKGLTVNTAATTVADKTYNNTTAATLTTVGFNGVVTGDEANVTATAATFASADAGTGITVNNLVLTGSAAANYTLTQPATLTGNILPAALTLTGAAAQNKAYDGNTNAVVTGTLSGVIGGDIVTFNGTGTFASANIGTGIAVASTATLTGADAANYTLTQPTGLTANITGIQLTVAATAADKVYDRTTTATLNVTQVNGIVSGDDVTVSGNGTFADFNVGNDKAITANLVLTGADAANYTLVQPTGLTADITAKNLTVNIAATTVADKTYNNTTSATLTTVGFNGIVTGDEANVTATAATFASADAGTGITVNNLVLTGSAAANYTLTQPTTLTGNILPAALTLTGAAAQNKAYDGNTNAVVIGTLSGIIGGDIVTFNGTGTFASANIGTGITVTSTATLTGADAANYTLTQPTGLTADITGIQLTVVATAADKVYDRTTTATLNVTQVNGIVSGDDVTVSGNGTFADFNVGNDKAITANLVLTGADAANYTLVQPTGLTADITAKNLTVNIAATTVADKTYNNTTSATLTTVGFNGIVTGDEANVTATAATFASADAGTGIAVNNLVLTGSAAANYTLTQPTTLTGNILPAALTLTGAAAQNKAYDGNTNAVVIGTLSGIIGGDIVTFNGTGTFASANIGTGITVTSTATLTGADAANYTLTQPTGLTANITGIPLTVTAVAQNKPYDGIATASVTNGQLSGGILAGDDVTLVATSVTGTFNNENAGTNKPVTAVFALQGTAAANYTLTQPTGLTANITPLNLTADVTGATVTSKVYDNTTTATVTGVVLTGLITGDVVTASGTFASADAGAAIPVSIALSGADAVNYTVTQPATALTGTITKKALTATADNKTKNQGAANPALTVSYTGFVTGQTAANAAGFTAPSAATTAVTASPAGAYPITLTGGSATNYELTLNNGWLIINPASGGAGNILAWDFTGEVTVPTSNAEVINANLDSSGTLTRGPGAPATNGNNSFRTQSFQNNGISVNNTDYFQFVVSASSGYQVSLNSITAIFNGTSTYAASPGVSHQFAYSLNGTTFTLINSPSVTVGISTPTITVNVSAIPALQNVPANTTVTFRYYASGQTSTGGWGFFSPSSGTYGLSVNGAVIAAPALPSITSPLAANSVINDTDSYQITASGTPVITYSAANLPAGATINDSGLISFDGTTPAGVYNIEISADSFYGTDTETLVYTVFKLNQSLTFNPDPIPNKYMGTAPFVVGVTNTSGLPVTWSSSDETVATVAQDGTITVVGVGTATITASNAGNAMYNPVTDSLTLTVLPTPVLTATPNPISFTATQGQGASAPVQLTAVTGANLVPATGDLMLTVSAGFEIAMGINPYGSTGTFAYAGGAVNQVNPQIYVRLAAGQAVGNYIGTLTITGGDATVQIPLTGVVEIAPAVTTTAAAFGPYCTGSANAISLAYTTEGTFGAGSFYVQHSNAAGIFPADFTNIISTAATASPISATLPATLSAGNYRVRVIHLSAALALTSSINNNGSDITINLTPAPNATALTFCNGATIAQLTATGTDLKWYAALTGGTELADTELLVTGSYFVSQTLNGCESIRTEVAVTVNTTPAPTATALTFCVGATVAELTATGTDLKWYSAITGGTELADTELLATGSYFVSQTLTTCESTRTEVAVTVNTTPAPTATALTFCVGATVAELTATGTDLKWYANATSVDELADIELLATGSYFVSQTLTTCESVRTEVAVTVNTTPAPTATALTLCNGATVAELTATGTDLKWYADATSVDELADTELLITGSYFVSQTLTTCESARAEVIVTINTTPAPTATALTLCNGATVAELTATGTDLKWYADATSVDELADTELLITGSYFVSQTLTTCESARAEVIVTINTTPAPTATALTLCNGATVAELTATGTDLKWYADATSVDELEDIEALATGSYFVSQTLNGCESTRTEVAVTISTVEAPQGLETQEFTAGETLADLDVTGDNLVWYADEELTTELPDTTVLTDGTTYYVVATQGECTSEVLAITVDEVLSTPSFDMSELKYYPNPVQEMLTITYSESITQVEIYDLNGKHVMTVKPNTANAQINMGNLQGGTYMLQVTAGEQSKTIRVIKKH